MLKKQNLLAAIFINLLLAKADDDATTPTAIDLSAANSANANYNPATDNPGLYSGLPTQMPEGLTQAPETFWRRSTLFGDVWGLRNKIENYGFDFDPVYTGEVFGNASGGMKQGAVYDH